MPHRHRRPRPTRRSGTGGGTALPQACPHVGDPFPECHCHAMTSAKIPLAIHYCQEHFEACEIFRRHGRR